jgi:hypothetical protein
VGRATYDAFRVDGYKIRYDGHVIDIRETDHYTWHESREITGLTRATPYCFQISTYNDFWGESPRVTTCATTLGGHPSGDQQTSIDMSRQQINSGYVPYVGSFGPISGGAVITKVNSPTSFPAVLLLKPGHSTEECGDPNAFVRVQGDMTDAQKIAVWGSASPTITGTQSLVFVGCSEDTGSQTILNQLPINLTCHYVP